MGCLSDVSNRTNVPRPVLVNESLVSWRTVKAVLIIIGDCAMSLDLPALVSLMTLCFLLEWPSMITLFFSRSVFNTFSKGGVLSYKREHNPRLLRSYSA